MNAVRNAMMGVGVVLLTLEFHSSLALGEIQRVSESTDHKQGNDRSLVPQLSAHGRTITYTSYASNLVKGDSNHAEDVFSFDRALRITARISLANDGAEGDSDSGYSPVSGDGRYVAFMSRASNLVEHDENATYDIFVRDRLDNRTILAAVSTSGEQENNFAAAPSISLDGRFVAFQSFATNLVENDDNNLDDVFLHDMQTGETLCISVTPTGHVGNSISGESPPSITPGGRYVAFLSDSTNLVGDEDENGDTNDTYDVFVRDMQEKKTVRASLGPNGEFGDGRSILPFISADGRYVTFCTESSTFGCGGAYVRDMLNGATEMIDVAYDGGCPSSVDAKLGSISADGRFVVFDSISNNLVSDDRNKKVDIFVRDRKLQATYRINLTYDGKEANDHSRIPAISANGRWVAFSSKATNLIKNDTNGEEDVFLVDFLGCSEHRRGDSNCDGVVDFSDIDGFVLALTDAGEYERTYLSCDWECNNDIDGDQKVDFNDIDGFVECLIKNGCP